MEGSDVEGIVIAGAGLAGLATALGLHRKGVRSLVLESSATLRASGFAFTTWTNAFRALDALGVGDKIREHHLLYESEAFLADGAEHDPGYEAVTAALEKYAEERRWRGIRLITAAYVVGVIQQSNNPVIKFLREKFFI
uniref:FAD-binding domain-containing protein n=1 Tax=Oryza meridionalis TaxID=40149 RepID=A0A0E0CVC2_9ORYZ